MLWRLTVSSLVCLAVAIPCGPSECGTCTQAECALEPGCSNEHLGNFESYCIPCPNGTCAGDGSLDITLGCADGLNVVVSLVLGIIGGLLAAALPCCCLSIRSQELWAAEFLDEENEEMRRCHGTIKEKHNHENVGGPSFSITIDFIAQSDDGPVPVRSKCGSQPSFWSKVKVGQEVDVIYRNGHVRDFVVAEDLLQRLMDTSTRYLLVIAGGCFWVLGIAFGVASWPATGCFLGIIPLVGIVIGGAIMGHIFFSRYAHHLVQRHFYVNTGAAAQSPMRSSSKIMSATSSSSLRQPDDLED